jgi:hypothetical protein
MDEVPGARVEILPPVFDIFLLEAHVGRDARIGQHSDEGAKEMVQLTIRAGCSSGRGPHEFHQDIYCSARRG